MRRWLLRSLMKKRFPFPLVHIEWKDAQTGHGWEDKENVLVEIPIVTTVGFLIKETGDGVVIASTVGTDLQSNARISIPQGMIISKKEL